MTPLVHDARRPFVLANFATTLDGKIAPSPGLRNAPIALSPHREDHVRMRALRGRADAVLIGAGNLRSDDPDLEPDDAGAEQRRVLGLAPLRKIVLTRGGEGLSPTQRLFARPDAPRAIVVHSARMPHEVRTRLETRAELVCLGEDAVPIDALFAWMCDTLQVRVLLCEGGGVLMEQLFRARAVDELYLTIVPRILGGVAAPSLVQGAGFRLGELPDAHLTSLEQVEDELFLRYRFDWNDV